MNPVVNPVVNPVNQIYARIVGVGAALPERHVSNAELVAQLASQGIETSDEWIVSRTGIRGRHLAQPHESTTSLAVQAARQALASCHVAVGEIDMILVATSTPDQVFPSTACRVQAALGADKAAAMDVQAVCSGFVYALSTANAMVVSGQCQKVLVIGAEVFSRLVDWRDRGTCVLFGDGAGAVVVAASDTPGILSTALHADGRQGDILYAEGRMENSALTGEAVVKMDGQSVFKQAVHVLEQCAKEALDRAGLSLQDLDVLVAHQANVRILSAVSKRLGLRDDQVVITVDRHGNTSAASVPLALAHAVTTGQAKSGHLALLQGVGGGFTWGSVLVRL